MFGNFTKVAQKKIKATRKQMFGKAPDVFTKAYSFIRVDTATALGFYPYYPKIEKSDATEVTIDGKQKVMLGSNNYLGLTNHSEVIEAGCKALKEYGSGLTGSRLLNGNIIMHDELEEKLAAFVNKEDALVFSTGFGANMPSISTITGKNDLIFSDEYNHASIVDGIRFSKADRVIYRHNDMEDLERKLREADHRKAKFIVTDGVFSMEGDIVKLEKLAELSKKYYARVMVDDAHSLGVLGTRGNGTASHFNLERDVDMIMGTFSKSLGCVGGFIASEKEVIKFLKHSARGMIFTASLPPSNVASVAKALEIIAREPERRETLMDNSEFMLKGLKELGFNVGESVTPIIPVIIGKDLKTFKVWGDLMEAGVYTNPVVSPAVPQGRGLLRTSYMATHTRKQLEFCLDMFEKVGRKHRVI